MNQIGVVIEIRRHLQYDVIQHSPINQSQTGWTRKETNKDDANHDPQWTVQQLTSDKLEIGGVVEFVLSDAIDSYSWRLWPHGDKRLLKDKQVYRNLKEVTSEDLLKVKTEKLNVMSYRKNPSLVVILMGSPVSKSHCDKIGDACKSFGMACEIRVTSAHKSTAETLSYEALGIPIVFVAVAGRSNELGPVLSGNTQFPVINCPQLIILGVLTIFGLGCSTILFPEAATIGQLD
uniref:PurE domain-containing protein n=1 Tax=Strigamia maritima TaxID=126957 RepID=T1IPL9_STRMM